MSYWWQRYANTPDANTSTPPDGAPEDHFPDQVNNIQRQAMAAVNEIGSLVLGPGDGTSAPQSAPSGINNDFLKLIYDQILPINTIQAWDSNGGVDPFPVPAGTAFASVVWELCDSTGSAGTPDFQDTVIAGANSLVGPNQKFTGDLTAAGLTGDGGLETDLSVDVGTHVITKAELPVYNLDLTNLTFVSTNNITDAGDQLLAGINTNGANPGSNTLGLIAPTQYSLLVSTVKAPGATIPLGGSATAHGHTGSTVDTPDHQHEAGQPAVAALELYKRVA